MAKSKRADGEVADGIQTTTADQSAEWMAQTAEAARSDANGQPVDQTAQEGIRRRRRHSGRVRQIQYWVCGRRHAADPARRIMPAPTIGRARKALAVVREMPDYGGMELWVERCTRVE